MGSCEFAVVGNGVREALGKKKSWVNVGREVKKV